MKKIIGLVLWLLAFLIPFQYSLLATEGVGNVTGLVSFVALLVLVFVGYLLVDSSGKQPAEGHSGH